MATATYLSEGGAPLVVFSTSSRDEAEVDGSDLSEEDDLEDLD